jgi:hypothetical protein
MNRIDFRESIKGDEPPLELSDFLKALWYDAKGDWKRAHEIIQDIEGENASWIHAYLHRKEGDAGNADYWYRKAGKRRRDVSLDKEWQELVASFT